MLQATNDSLKYAGNSLRVVLLFSSPPTDPRVYASVYNLTASYENIASHPHSISTCMTDFLMQTTKEDISKNVCNQTTLFIV